MTTREQARVDVIRKFFWPLAIGPDSHFPYRKVSAANRARKCVYIPPAINSKGELVSKGRLVYAA